MKKSKKLGVLITQIIVLIILVTQFCTWMVIKNLYIKRMQHNAITTLVKQAQNEALIMNDQVQIANTTACDIADIAYDTRYYNQDLLRKQILEKLNRNSMLFGMGIWYEPYVVDPSKKYYGSYLYNTGKGDKLTFDYNSMEYDYFKRNWYKNAFKFNNKNVKMTDIFYDNVLKTYFITATSPIYKNGKIMGCVTADLSLRNTIKKIENIKVGTGGKAYLCNENGFLEQYSKDLIGVHYSSTLNNKFKQLLRGIQKSHHSTYMVYDTGKEYAVCANIGTTPLKIVLVLEKTELFGSIRNSELYALILLVIIFGFTILALQKMFHRYVENPLNIILNKVNLISSGDLSRDDRLDQLKNNNAEFGELAVSINNMADSMSNTIKSINKKNLELDESRDILWQLAYFDEVTRLPNKVSLAEKLKKRIDHSSEKHPGFAVISINFGNIGQINDVYGFSVGDSALFQIAEKLKRVDQKCCYLSKLDGAKFTMLTCSGIDRKYVEYLDEKIREILGSPIEVEQYIFYLAFSIGVALFPDDGNTAGDLIKASDTAMYSAREKGRDTTVFYSEAMRDKVLYRLELEAALRDAMNNDEFVLYYQPLFSTSEKRIKSYEALIRWNSRTHGLIPPDKFISIAEDTKLIIPIGKWIIESACKLIKQLSTTDRSYITVCVNISVVQLMDKDFADFVIETFENHGVSFSSVIFEITESRLMESYDFCIENIMKLKQRNIEFSIDDFGTGYSSLYYLKQLPVSSIKIDKSFIDELDNPKSRNFVELIISLSKNLGLRVVSEGVESEEQYKILSDYGCNFIQGYYIGKPAPLDKMALQALFQT